MVNGTPFMLIRRKGWKVPKWEQIISIPEAPSISPWHLIQKYVELTSVDVPPGSPLLVSLKRPFKPLSANTVGSLTKEILSKYGIPTQVWGAHSTRGAGVLLYKRLGLTSVEVCEIGKWKNVQAFSAH